MTEVRRRRPYRNKSGGGKNGYLKSRGGQGEAVTYLGMSPQQLLANGAGLLVCLWVGYKHASYMALIHDNNTWFSSIKVMFMSKRKYLLYMWLKIVFVSDHTVKGFYRHMDSFG